MPSVRLPLKLAEVAPDARTAIVGVDREFHQRLAVLEDVGTRQGDVHRHVPVVVHVVDHIGHASAPAKLRPQVGQARLAVLDLVGVGKQPQRYR